MTLEELYQIIQDRKDKMPKGSYVASLFKGGRDKIIQKVAEEATEVVIAAKNESKRRVVFEVADLLFHLWVMLSALDIQPKAILTEFDKRKNKKKVK